MKENEMIYVAFLGGACVAAILALQRIMTIEEGISGTLAVFLAAVAVYALHNNSTLEKW
jgi:hypothetical protein